MVDFPSRSEFTTRRGPGGVPLVGPPKSLSANEIADLFADLGKLTRRDKAATLLVTALRKRLDKIRATCRQASRDLDATCSYLATIDGGEAKDQQAALIALGDKLRHEANSPEVVQVALEPLPGIEKEGGAIDAG